MLTIPRTFSPIMNLGWNALIMRNISGQRCLSSLVPFCLPATENGWHGKPPVMMSGNSMPSSLNFSFVISLTSSYTFIPFQCLSNIALLNLSLSQKATVSKCPVLSNPNEKPPNPLKRSNTLYFCFDNAKHLWPEMSVVTRSFLFARD